MLKKLQSLNKFPLYSCDDTAFKRYGQVIDGYDFSAVMDYIAYKTEVPGTGNVYKMSVPEMESDKICEQIKNSAYGGLSPQFGYCNGNNSFLHGLEYHKGSEINVAVTPLVLLLAHTWDIMGNKIDSSRVEGFYIPEGKAVELYQTTMHFAPCKVNDSGFKCIVILPAGTNGDLDLDAKEILFNEDRFLFKINKWLLVHEDRADLVSKGAFLGITGSNIELKYK